MGASASMKFPNISIERATPVGNGTDTPVEAVRGFAMVPSEVVVDPRLQHVDVRIYNVLALCRQGSTVKIGTRLIGKYARTSQRRIAKSLGRLVSCGYVTVDRGINGARAKYGLTSDWFRGKIDIAIGAESTPVDALREAAKAIECPRCHQRRRQILKVGYCRTCKSNDKFDLGVRRIAREEIAKAEVA